MPASRFKLGAAVLTAALGVAPATAPAQSVPPDLAASNKAIISAAYDRWVKGGRTFYDDVLALDMEWTIIGTGLGAGTYRGREAFEHDVIAPFTALLATPIQPVVRHVWADGDDVIVRWSGTATTKSAKPYRNEYLWIFHMRDGRADRDTAFLDLPAYQAVFREK